MVRIPVLDSSPWRLAVGFLLLAIACGIAQPRAAAAQNMDSTDVARFQLADSFIRAGQFDRAITLLEDLYAASPNNYAFYDKLRTAYESMKRYDDAVDLVNERLSSGQTPTLLSDLARLFYLQDEEERAREIWEEAIDTGPDQPNTYRVVYQSLMEVRQFDWAIEMLESAREATGDPELFRADLAYLHNLTGNHERAMGEYLEILRTNEQQVGFVRNRLSRFVEQEEALRSSIAVASRAVREEPLNRAFRELLGWLYIEIESYDDALNAYRAIDRLEQENGTVLFNFAQMAADAAAYEAASEAFREILERYPEAPSAAPALAGLGEMHERWADRSGERAFDETGGRIAAVHYEEALETYRRFLDRFPNHALYPEVLRRVGRLQQDIFYEFEAAETTLEKVAESYPNTNAATEAQYDLGRLALMRGQMDEARLRFNRLIDRLRTGDIAELARYKLAQIHFFTGEFDAAQSLVDVIDVNTSTDVSNDAIELKLLLMENRGPDSLNTPLQSFARIMLAQEQRQYQAALDSLDGLLARQPSHALADDARYLRAEILRTIGRSEEAARVFQEFPLMHPQSHLADRALFAAAEMFEQELDDADAAARLYAQLLSDFPGSLLAGQARDRLRRLRSDGA